MDKTDFIRHAIIVTFCIVMLMVFGTMCYGLFDNRVDNNEVFKFMGHAFDMVMVGLTSFLGGRAIAKLDKGGTNE